MTAKTNSPELLEQIRRDRELIAAELPELEGETLKLTANRSDLDRIELLFRCRCVGAED